MEIANVVFDRFIYLFDFNIINLGYVDLVEVKINLRFTMKLRHDDNISQGLVSNLITNTDCLQLDKFIVLSFYFISTCLFLFSTLWANNKLAFIWWLDNCPEINFKMVDAWTIRNHKLKSVRFFHFLSFFALWLALNLSFLVGQLKFFINAMNCQVSFLYV